jgi:hypothetical protein
MLEVFKTNVCEVSEARELVGLLSQQFPGARINFDLHDCDKVLRVEGTGFEADKVILVLKEKGFACTILE